jgi:hypothetical protein
MLVKKEAEGSNGCVWKVYGPPMNIASLPSSNKRMQFREWLEGTFIAHWSISFLASYKSYIYLSLKYLYNLHLTMKG